MTRNRPIDRRQFVKQMGATLLAGTAVPYFSTKARAGVPPSKNDRPGIGSIGMRYQGSVIARKAAAHGDIVAICDVDQEFGEKARKEFGVTTPLFGDYRKMLERPDIDVITIGTPDHWHTKILIDACRAGKDVYCEKPLTLTVDEGKQLTKVVRETGRVVQVGSWQRSDHRFRLAVEMVRQGRIGKLQRVDVVLGKNKTSGPFTPETPPAGLNWDMWQGQTPAVPYIKERCHYTFSWWYEYSGGQMTDWGAHHLDIAQWGIGELPVKVEGNARFPDTPNAYNVAIDFFARYVYPSGVEMTVSDTGRNGIMFTGSEGRLFVTRGTLSGAPVEALKDAPLPRDKFVLYPNDNLTRPERMGKLDSIVNHMGNFFDCVQSRKKPISDVVSQHQSVTTCHIGNISMRIGRKLAWDSDRELFVKDETANAWLTRPQREGYEIDAG